MSQKEGPSSKNKWQDMAEQEEQNDSESPKSTVDDEHLLPDETSVKTLLDKVNLLEKQSESYKDQSARAQAELENVRRRMDQEVSKARKFGVERLISEMIPVVDSLTRALEGVNSDDPQVKSMQQGIELTLDILNKLLEKNGILAIDPKQGDTFDPMQHEAMSMRPDSDAKPNTILQVLQKGYALHGRVVKAAMVIVAS